MATECSFCDEPRIGRCSYADCPWEVDDAQNTIARLTAEITTLRARLETVEAERDKAAEIAEAYRSAMLDTETLLNSLPVPISSTGDTSLVWKRVSDAADRLRAARHDVIYSHGPFAIRNLEPRHD